MEKHEQCLKDSFRYVVNTEWSYSLLLSIELEFQIDAK